jgi:hypothetical protein
VNVNRGTLTVGIIVIIVGLGIGAALAMLTRGSGGSVQQVTVMDRARPTSAARVVASTPRALATALVPVATVTDHAAPANAAPPTQGTWRLDEANNQVGTIVWVGQATPMGSALVLDVRKQSVGGRAAVPCERETALHASLRLTAGAQTATYREVNCTGATSTGELRVAAFSPDGTSFTGSFWSDGMKLGDVSAHRL